VSLSSRHSTGLWQPSIEMIRARRMVASVFGVSEEELLSRSRVRHVAQARQAVCYVVRAVWPAVSYPCIARLVGLGDHSTVLHACRVVAERAQRDLVLADQIAGLVAGISGRSHVCDADAHVVAWRAARLAAVIDAAEAASWAAREARQAAAAGAAVSVYDNAFDDLVARGVAVVNVTRKVKPKNELDPDDVDALRRKKGGDALSRAIAQSGGWR